MTSVYGSTTGLQDAYLTENPEVSLFYPTVTLDQPNHVETYLLPFDTGDFRRCTIPYKGDYITDITIKMSLPGLVNTNDNFWTFSGTPPPGYVSFYGYTPQNNIFSKILKITPSNFDVNQVNLFQNQVLPYISNVAAGPDFSLFTVSDSNYIFVAGNNSKGQLGTGNTSNVTAMISYFPPFNIPVAKIACGKSHTAVLDSSGTIWTCGDNSKGQLGNGIVGQTSPVTSFVPVATGSFLDIQCTNYATLILVSGGQVAKTGTNVYGELGSDTTVYSSFVYLTDSGFPPGITSISCGPDFTLLASSSSVYSSGNNSSGQLGRGSFSSSIFGFSAVSYETSSPTWPVKLMTGNGYSVITDTNMLSAWVTGNIGLNNFSNYVNSSHKFFNATIYGENSVGFSSVYNNLTTVNFISGGLVVEYDTYNLYAYPPTHYTYVASYPIFSFGTVTLFGNSIMGDLTNGALGTGLGGCNTYNNIIGIPAVIKNYITFTFPFNTGAITTVFDSIDVANYFGYDYKDLNILPSNFYYFVGSSTLTSTLTLRQSGFIQGYDVAVPNTNTYKYPSWQNIINSMSLYIGNQLIQYFPQEFLEFKKEISNTYKNRPILKLIEGDGTIVVPIARTFFIDTGLLKMIPIHALGNQDVQLRVDIGIPIPGMALSTLVTYVKLKDASPNTVYSMVVPSVTTRDPKGPCTKIFSSGTFQNLTFNGEHMADSNSSNVAPFDSLLNVPLLGNCYVFDGPINFSRIRDIQVTSSPTSNIYYENLNVLQIKSGLAGLLFS